MSKISKYFTIQEMVPKEIYLRFGRDSQWFIDPRLMTLLDFIREFIGVPMTVNNWNSGGTLSQRGYRIPDTPTGGRLSQHKFGRAADVSYKGKTVQEVYNLILANEKVFMDAGLTTLENIEFTKSWLHCDIRWTGLNKILIVNP
jgi:hypothetical protein